MKKFLIVTTIALCSLSVQAGGVGSEGTGSFTRAIVEMFLSLSNR